MKKVMCCINNRSKFICSVIMGDTLQHRSCTFQTVISEGIRIITMATYPMPVSIHGTGSCLRIPSPPISFSIRTIRYRSQQSQHIIYQYSKSPAIYHLQLECLIPNHRRFLYMDHKVQLDPSSFTSHTVSME